MGTIGTTTGPFGCNDLVDGWATAEEAQVKTKIILKPMRIRKCYSGVKVYSAWSLSKV